MNRRVHAFDSLPEAGQPGTPAPTQRVARERPLIGLIRNTRSHREGGPLPTEGLGADIISQVPDRRELLHGILQSFADRHVDAIAISGGDGTVRDVLTSGLPVFGKVWPPIILLPYGKTNALAMDIGVPQDWDLRQAVPALQRQRRGEGSALATRRPMAISEASNPSARVAGFVTGAGAFTNMIELGQKVHGLGAVNALAVGMTTVWSVLQMLFGRAGNRWRRPVGMEISVAGAPLTLTADTGEATGGQRRFLMFASSLETLPAGIDPFRHVAGPIGLAVIDRLRPRQMPLILRLLRGGQAEQADADGIHLVGTQGFAFSCAEKFILDGEAFPPGSYVVEQGPELAFVVP